MPVNGMNVGADYNITYYDSVSGQLINLGDVQSVRITALKHDVKSMPYNQPPKYGYIPDGHKVDFTVTRTGSQLEDFAVLNEANFNNGLIQSPGVLNETVYNPDGTTSRYQYTGLVVFLTDHGDIARDKTVTQSFEGMASKKVKIS